MTRKPVTKLIPLRTILLLISMGLMVALAILGWRNRVAIDGLFIGLLAASAALMAAYVIAFRKAELGLEEARARAEQSSQTVQTYVRILSREVRNPISELLSSVEDLRPRLDSPAQLRDLAQIQQSAQAAKDIVQGIVGLNNPEVLTEIQETTAVRIQNSVETCFRIVRFSANEEINLSYHIDSSVPEFVYCDSMRLSQVLLNLVGNAVKYTSEGNIDVRVSATVPDAKIYKVRFVISDDGVGIADQDLEGIFEPYVRATYSGDSERQRTGLGLSLVKTLVTDMGGTISVESRLGVGSQFTVNLPMESVKTVEIDPSRISASVNAQDEKEGATRVLVAEDNPINQMVACRMLERLGCVTEVAEDGKKALSAAQKGSFDLVLMDLQMPEMDGITTTRRILETVENPPRIVAVTANVLEEEKQRCIAAGMSDFLSKPIKLEMLSNCLVQYGLRP